MLAALEAEGYLPRPQISITVVDRATVRSIVHAERALVKRAYELGIDTNAAHSGYATYIEGVMKPLSEDEQQKFQQLLVDEALNNEDLDKAQASAAAAERHYAEVLKKSKSPSTGRIFMAGVSVTILIGLALFWAFK